jgi:hypothetical protein
MTTPLLPTIEESGYKTLCFAELIRDGNPQTVLVVKAYNFKKTRRKTLYRVVKISVFEDALRGFRYDGLKVLLETLKRDYDDTFLAFGEELQPHDSEFCPRCQKLIEAVKAEEEHLALLGEGIDPFE